MFLKQVRPSSLRSSNKTMDTLSNEFKKLSIIAFIFNETVSVKIDVYVSCLHLFLILNLHS